MTIEEREVLTKAIETYGPRAQQDMMIEEMSELTKAILKYRRNPSPETLDNILEEMADVEIMIEQMKIMFGECPPMIGSKIARLSSRLAEAAGGSA